MTDHDPAATAVISAELGRCVLGASDRPELRVGAVGELARMAISFQIASADLGARLLPVMQEMALSVRQIVGMTRPCPDPTTRLLLVGGVVAVWVAALGSVVGR